MKYDNKVPVRAWICHSAIEQTVEILFGNWGRGANGNKPSLLNKPSVFANNQVYLKETKFL
jgi:hypothetical protein